MIFEHEACAVVLAVAAAAFEGYQVDARVVVLGVAAGGAVVAAPDLTAGRSCQAGGAQTCGGVRRVYVRRSHRPG